MRTSLRVRLSALAVAALAVVALTPGAAAAGPPPAKAQASAGSGEVATLPDTLGGAIAPAPFYVASDGARVLVFNRSELSERFTVASGDGWTFEPTSFALEPGERQSVAVTSVGTDGAEIAVLVESTEPTPAGVERGVVSLVTQLHSGERPAPGLPEWVVLCLAALAAVLVGISALWAKRRGNSERHF